MPVKVAEFRQACALYATGVAVATVLDGAGNPRGLTINSFTSVSLEPPLILFCIEKAAGLYATFMEAKHYGINVLAGGQQFLSERFAFFEGDRFAGVEWFSEHAGAPRLAGALAWLAARVEQRVDAGDHTVLLGLVEEVGVADGEPLIYFQSAYRSFPR